MTGTRFRSAARPARVAGHFDEFDVGGPMSVWAFNPINRSADYEPDDEIMTTIMADVVLPDGTHWYWSTHCRHGRHADCAATELAPGVPRRPAQCKTCGSPCRCPCGHRSVDTPPPGFEDTIYDGDPF